MNNVAAFQQTLDDSRLKGLELYYQMARLQSTKNFLVMPNEELFGITGAAPENQFPAHNDFLKSHAVYWLPGRSAQVASIRGRRGGQDLVAPGSAGGRVGVIGAG